MPKKKSQNKQVALLAAFVVLSIVAVLNNFKCPNQTAADQSPKGHTAVVDPIQTVRYDVPEIFLESTAIPFRLMTPEERITVGWDGRMPITDSDGLTLVRLKINALKISEMTYKGPDSRGRHVPTWSERDFFCGRAGLVNITMHRPERGTDICGGLNGCCPDYYGTAGNDHGVMTFMIGVRGHPRELDVRIAPAASGQPFWTATVPLKYLDGPTPSPNVQGARTSKSKHSK